MEIFRTPKSRKWAVALFLAVVGSYLTSICEGQVLDQISIDPGAGEYRPILINKDTAMRIGRDGSIDAIDLNTEHTLWRATGLGGPIVSVAKARSGSLFGALSNDGTLRIWELSLGRLRRVETAGHEQLVRIEMSPDGKRLVTQSESDRLAVSDSVTGKRMRSVTWSRLAESAADIGGISALKFSADGMHLLIGTAKGSVYIWDLDGTSARLIDRIGQEPVTTLATATGSTRWASGDAGGRIYISETMDRGHAKEFISLPGLITELEFDASGQLLLACRSSMNVATGKRRGGSERIGTYASTLPCAALGPGGQDVYAADRRGNLRRWRRSSGLNTLTPLSLYPSVGWNTGASSSTRQLFDGLRGTAFGLFWVFRLPSIVEENREASVDSWTPGIPHQWSVESKGGSLRVDFSPRRGLRVTTTDNLEQRIVAIPGGPATSCALSSSAELDAVVGYADGQVGILRDGQIRKVVQMSQSAIVALTVDGLSNTVAAADLKGVIKIWRPLSTQGTETETIANSKDVSELRFAPGSSEVLLVYSPSGIKFVGLRVRETVGNVFATPGLLEWIAVSEHGFFDGPVSLWDFVTLHIPSSRQVLPLSAIVTDFYRPGLLDVLMEGHTPEDDSDLSRIDRRQPTVHLLAEYIPAIPNQPQGPGWIKVTVNAEEAHADADWESGSGLRDLRLFRNGLLVRVWRGDLPLKDGRFVVQTSLVAGFGTQHLLAYAFNKQDVKGKDFELEVTVPAVGKKERTLHVLAIGISSYQNQQMSLQYADEDAKTFSTVFSESVRQVGSFDHIKVPYLLLNEQATKRNILLALRRLSGGSRPLVNSPLPQVLSDIDVPGPDDVVVLYYSGHAGLVDGNFYLFPYDADVVLEQDKRVVEKIKKTSISGSDLSRAIERIDGTNFLLIVDACQSGQLLVSSDPRLGPINARGFAHVAFEKGMSLIVAAMPEQLAWEDKKGGNLRHGLLTYALIEGLSKAVRGQSQEPAVLTVEEWFDFAAKRVPELYRALFSRNENLLTTESPSISTSEMPGYQQPIVFMGKEDKRKFVVQILH